MSSRIRTENRRASLAQRLALAPYSVWAVIFVAVPLVFVAYYAFTDESFRFTTENLTKFFLPSGRSFDMIIHGRGISAAGSAPRWQRGGHGFEPRMLHWKSIAYAVLFLLVCNLL